MPETFNRTPAPRAYDPAYFDKVLGEIQRQLRVSATDKLLGRTTAGAGVIEEIAFTDAAQTLLAHASAYVGPTAWTPADGSGAALTFSSVVATYHRVGTLVIARFDLTYPATADGSNAVISGLPVATANAQDARQGFVSFSNETTLAYVVPAVNASTAALIDSAGAAVTNATMSGNRVIGTLLYRSA